MKSLRRVSIAVGLASTAAIAAPALESMERPVQPQTRDQVTYMCGGVGQPEVEYMKQAARNYDVMLTFASHSGAYLADVAVSITDARGVSVMQAVCGGPIMLVDLPRSGAYRVRATTAGYELSQTIRAAGKGYRSYVLLWPQQAEDAGLMPAPL